jgi:predicted RNase H-like nuclease (RuvC/YqgF family)
LAQLQKPFQSCIENHKKSQPSITTDYLGFHEQANTAASIVDQVIEKLSAQISDQDTSITAETLAEQQMQQKLLNMANSSQQNQQMLNQMTALATTVLTLQKKLNNNNQEQGNHRRRGRRNNDRCRHGGAGHGNTAHVFKYCWSHRNCAHNRTNCKSKADGHINDATYANMQGGNTT